MDIFNPARTGKPFEVQELFIDIKKILLATDGSKSAINATKYAVALAKVFNAKVRAVFVDNTSESQSQPKITEDTVKEGISNTFNGRIGLSVAKEYSLKNNVEYDEKVVTGHISKKIIESSREFSPDLIIIGNSEKSGIRRSLGSVADAVMKGTDIPVLVIASER
ncbi:MAG: universal stress protein [Actinomycetota bacterium]